MLRDLITPEPPGELRDDPSQGPQGPYAPAGQKNFQVFRRPNTKILEKSRAARAECNQNDHQNQELTADNGKSEDPAKMTHSIPDAAAKR